MKKLLIALGCLCLLIAGSSQRSRANDLFQSESGRGVLTNADVIDLSKQGLSDSAIVQRIRCSRTNFTIGTEESKRLISNGVSEAVIRAMHNSQKRPSMNCSENSSSHGSVAPQGPTRLVHSKPEDLTPAQLKAQEEATRRANPPGPIPLHGTQGPAPKPRNPPVEPVTSPVEESPQLKAGSKVILHNQQKKKRKRTHRKKGDQS